MEWWCVCGGIYYYMNAEHFCDVGKIVVDTLLHMQRNE